MKKIAYTLAAAALLLASTAHADRGDQYALAKFGAMSVDLNKADPLVAFGFVYGYGLTPRISAEAELNLGLLGGKYKDASGETGEYRIWTLGTYGVYRFPVTDIVYLKGKAGFLYEGVSRTSSIVDDKSSYGFFPAIGLGVGASVPLFGQSRAVIEAEFATVDKDVKFWSIGTHLAF